MNVDDFADLVREYKGLVDNFEGSTAHGFLSSCATLLPRIYAAGIQLPEVEPGSVEVERSQSEISGMRALLGKYDDYFLIFDPCVNDEPVVGLISNDLAEIYDDLVNPLVTLEAGRIEDAVWEWSFNIRGHCGDHSVNTMRVIHRLVHDHMSEDYVADADASA